jgi:hypothetical protein
MRSKALLAVVTAMLVAACGGAPSALPNQSRNHHATATQQTATTPSTTAGTAAHPPGDATDVQGGGTGSPVQGTGGTATTRNPNPSGGASSTPKPGQPGPQPTARPTGGSCPDPRYCADYFLSGGAWPMDNSGRVTIHYRINPAIPAGVSFTGTRFVQAVQDVAQTWMTADPSVQFAFDGTTTDQPVNFNNVVGFAPVASGYANIPLNVSSDGRTYTGFNIQLQDGSEWNDEPCNGATVPCSPYSGTGVDLRAMLAHCWGHVLGLGDLAASSDSLLTDYGGIAAGPDCGAAAGPVCRFAATLGLGDVLGARHLYPTSAQMPTLYDDQ